MEYFAGLDIAMEETQVCVLDRDGVIICEAKAASTAEAITTYWQEHQVVAASFLRPAGWRRCSSMA